jgi:hypothetical protein
LPRIQIVRIGHLEAAGNLHVVSILRYLLGEPRGAAELAEQGVRDPDKMCRLVIPRLEAA